MKEDKEIKIVFMGTSGFAIPALEALHSEFGIKCLVTLPDKPQGRGRKPVPTPVKNTAEQLELPVLQPEYLKDEEFIDALKSIEPDIICVVAFRILPKIVYEIPQIGTFNIHPSLLPKYRGAAPINWTIINGERETGISSFLLQDKIDAGDIILQKKYEVKENWTAGDLHDFLSKESAHFAVETCRALLSDSFRPLKQDESQASSAPKLFAEKSEINWKNSAINVRNFIHGHSPIPGAWTIFHGKRFKIFRVLCKEKANGGPGTFHIDKNNFTVNCETGAISLLEFQLPDKKLSSFKQFRNGYRGEKEGKFGI